MRRFAIIALTVLIGAFSFYPEPTQAEAKQATKFVRFQVGEDISYGIVEGSRVRQISGDLFGSWEKGNKTYPLSAVKVLAPTTPTKVLAAAGNYRSHLGDSEPPENPQLFFKVPSCLIAAGENIVIPKATDNVHYEAELVIVIGKRARDVSVGEANEYILGVTCGNDVSARDWQHDDVQWWRAKGSDTFGPCGPFIASGIDYNNLKLQLRVNGEVKQEQNTSDMVHSIDEIVSWASRHVTLEPGDLIYTGTPGTTEALKPGDVVEVELEGAGVLRNPVVKAR